MNSLYDTFEDPRRKQNISKQDCCSACFSGAVRGRKKATHDLEKVTVEASNDQDSGMTDASLFFNVLNSIVVGGTCCLTMPQAAQWSGIVLFPVLVLGASIASYYSADLLGIGTELTETYDFPGYLRVAFGPKSEGLLHLVFFLGVSTGMNGNILAIMGCFNPIIPISHLAWTIIILVVSLLQSSTVSSMELIVPYSKAAGFILWLFLFYVLVQSIIDFDKHVTYDWGALHLWPSSLSNVFNSLSLVFGAVVFQSTAPSLYAEVRTPRRETWQKGTARAQLVSGFVFVFCGMVPAFVHPASGDNLLIQFSGSVLGNSIIFLLGISFILSTPLVTWMGINALLAFGKACGDKNDDEEVNLLDETAMRARSHGGYRGIVAKVVLFLCVFFSSFWFTNLAKMGAILSAFSVVPVNFTIPFLIHIKLTRKTDMDSGIYSSWLAWIAAIVSLVVYGISLYSLHSII